MHAKGPNGDKQDLKLGSREWKIFAGFLAAAVTTNFTAMGLYFQSQAAAASDKEEIVKAATESDQICVDERTALNMSLMKDEQVLELHIQAAESDKKAILRVLEASQEAAKIFSANQKALMEERGLRPRRLPAKAKINFKELLNPDP